MKPQGVSLRVLAAYARDVGRGVVRIDGSSMDVLGVAEGDVVESIGKKDGADARCYRLLPSDEDQGIVRIDPALRKMIGVAIDNTVTIRKITDTVESAEAPAMVEQEAEKSMPPSPNSSEDAGPGTKDTATTAAAALPSSAAVFVLSGSCIDFEKERPKIMYFITTLESATSSQSKCKC